MRKKNEKDGNAMPILSSCCIREKTNRDFSVSKAMRYICTKFIKKKTQEIIQGGTKIRITRY